jgi:hypothetical protein
MGGISRGRFVTGGWGKQVNASISYSMPHGEGNGDGMKYCQGSTEPVQHNHCKGKKAKVWNAMDRTGGGERGLRRAYQNAGDEQVNVSPNTMLFLS